MRNLDVYRRFGRMLHDRTATFTAVPCLACDRRQYLNGVSFLETGVFLSCTCSGCGNQSMVCWDGSRCDADRMPEIHLMYPNSTGVPVGHEDRALNLGVTKEPQVH